MVNFNFHIQTNEQYLKQKERVTVDSDSVKSQVNHTGSGSTAKSQSVFTETSGQVGTTNANLADTNKVVQNYNKSKAKKAARPVPPKPEIGVKTTSINSVQTVETPDGITKTAVGSFDTNIPTFSELKIENKKAVANASGVGIYSTRKDGEDQGGVKVKHFDGPPAYDEVSFRKGTSVKIPQQKEPVKGSIVFNPDTSTYAFNNIEGVEIMAQPRHASAKKGADGKYYAGGEKFLVSGGSVARIDTAEVAQNFNDGGININTKPQTIVLQNTSVENGVLNVGGDKVLALDTSLKGAEINTSERARASHLATMDSSGKLVEDTPANTKKLQTGYSAKQALSSWLGGGDVSELVANQGDMQGSVKIDNEAFAAVNMENASVARTIGNLNIYNTANDGAQIFAEESNGKIKITIGHTKINHKIDFTINSDQPKADKNGNGGAKIFFDKETGTIVMENIQGLEFHPSDKEEEAMRVKTNLLLKDCQVDYLSTVDRNTSISGLTEDMASGLDSQSNIALAGDTTVKEMHTSYDNVFVTDNAEVEQMNTFADNIYTVGDNAKIDEQKHSRSARDYQNRMEYRTKNTHVDSDT